MKRRDISNIMEDENHRMEKLHKIVEEAIQEEQLIVQELSHPKFETLSKAQVISDNVARFGGSWRFIITFGIIIFLWITINVISLTNYKFDPYPFILLNLILSCIAALQAPIIMMSQNRQEEKDRKRNENDYLINLKAEIQIRSLHQKMDLLLEEQIKSLFETQAKQFELLNNIERKLNQTQK